MSEEETLASGVAQGAVLSPLLFNLMLSDIPEQDDIQCHVYADDITVTCVGNNIMDIKRKLQQYINTFMKWTEEWGLELNPNKTYMQIFTNKKVTAPVIRIKNHLIIPKDKQRLLGMILDAPKLTWNSHIDQIK